MPFPFTKLKKDVKASTVIVLLRGGVAKRDQVGKSVFNGLRIEPATEGKWSWTSDSQLTFVPAHDWPAEQKYRVRFDQAFFPKHVLLQRYEIELTTPPFADAIKKIEFYQDPQNPAVRQVVSTLEFTHSDDRDNLQKHIAPMVGG